jgi:hypothetical protein
MFRNFDSLALIHNNPDARERLNLALPVTNTFH